MKRLILFGLLLLLSLTTRTFAGGPPDPYGRFHVVIRNGVWEAIPNSYAPPQIFYNGDQIITKVFNGSNALNVAVVSPGTPSTATGLDQVLNASFNGSNALNVICLSGCSTGTAYGELAMAANGTATTLTTQNTWYQVGAGWSADQTLNTTLLASTASYAITALNQGTKTFTIAGDHRPSFIAGYVFVISASTGNNGTYTVVSATLNTGNTDIVVVEAIPNAVADGSIATDVGNITSGVTGEFTTIGTVGFTSGVGTNLIQFAVFKNGVQIPSHTAVTWTNTAVFPNTVTMSGIDALTAGDVLDIRARCTNGGCSGIAITVSDANFSIFTIH